MDYDNFLDWSVNVELLMPSEKKELVLISREDPEQAENVFNHIIESREILYDLFLAIARNSIPDSVAQSKFNTLLTEALSHLNLQVRDDLVVHETWKRKSDLSCPLHPVIKSAYELLTAEMPDRIKECGACGWLFLDQSKNKSRKWCSMESCGSIVKAKRYYHKNKKKKE